MHILLLCLMLLPNISYSENIRMVTSEWPPFYGKELNKGGVSIEIVRQALKRKGHTLTVDFLPWAKSMNLSLKGDYDALFGAWKNTENEQNYKFSKEHFGRGDGHFIDLMSSSAHELVPEDLVGKSIAYVSGYPISEELSTLITFNKISNYQVDTVDQLIKMHQANRIDFILDNIRVVRYHFSKVFPETDFNLKAVGKDYIDGRLYVAWTKEKELDEVIQDLDNALFEMKNDGTIIKIESEFH